MDGLLTKLWGDGRRWMTVATPILDDDGSLPVQRSRRLLEHCVGIIKIAASRSRTISCPYSWVSFARL